MGVRPFWFVPFVCARHRVRCERVHERPSFNGGRTLRLLTEGGSCRPRGQWSSGGVSFAGENRGRRTQEVHGQTERAYRQAGEPYGCAAHGYRQRGKAYGCPARWHLCAAQAYGQGQRGGRQCAGSFGYPGQSYGQQARAYGCKEQGHLRADRSYASAARRHHPAARACHRAAWSHGQAGEVRGSVAEVCVQRRVSHLCSVQWCLCAGRWHACAPRPYLWPHHTHLRSFATATKAGHLRTLNFRNSASRCASTVRMPTSICSAIRCRV